MAIKINGVDVIDDDRRGIFAKLNPGVYTTSQIDSLSGLSAGEIVYDSDQQKLFVYNGSAWTNVGVVENALSPTLPPYIAYAETDTFLKSTDGKVTFSLDDSTYDTTLAVPRGTPYYVGWGTDIRDASHGSSYSASIGATFTQIGTSGTTRTVEFSISSVDKVPDLSLGFSSVTGATGATEYESDIISTFETINAPAQLWVTSDATSYKVRTGVGTWFDAPSIPGTTYINQNEEIQVKHTTGSGALTDYTTTVNVGYGTAVGQFASADFVTQTSNVIYDNPTLSPGDNSTIDRNGQVFTMSNPSGTNVSHQSTDWQFASNSDFSTILVQSLNDTSNMTTYTLSGISDGTTVYARARFKDASGVYSNYATSSNLSAVTFYRWRWQFHIEAGNGANSAGGQGGGTGGEGYVVLESTSTSASSPAGTAEWYNGERGKLYNNNSTDGTGAFGYNGGLSVNYSGGGGGAAAIKLNNTLIAGVGGGGGASWGENGAGSGMRGGVGADLPSAAGGNGSGAISWSNATNGSGGASSSTGGSGGNGSSSGSGAGAGGGGFGPGTGGTFDSSVDRSGGSGGGGGSWNQSINYTNGNWKMTHAQASNVMGSSDSVAKYRAPSNDLNNYSLVSSNNSEGSVNLT